MNDLIVSAIAEKAVLSLVYDGRHRAVEPHAYGVNHRGHDVLRCFQVSGGSSSGQSHDWKLLLVHDASAITRTGATFSTARPDYKRGDEAMRHIYAQL